MTPDSPSPGQSRQDRILPLLSVLLLAAAVAVIVILVVDLLGTPICADATVGEECFEISSLQETAALVLGFGSAALGTVGVVLGLLVLRSRTSQRELRYSRVAGLAVVLGVAAYVVSSI